MRVPLTRCSGVVALGAWLLASSAFAELRAVATPTRVTAGTSQSVSVQVEPDSVGAHIAASVGSLRKDLGHPDAFLWDPPSSRQPQWALLVFWKDRGTRLPEVAIAPVPIDGRTDLEVETEPLASVTVEVGAEKFGPVLANARGKVTVPVTVPPDTHEVQVVAVRRGRSKLQTLPLTPPASRWVAFFSPASFEARQSGTLVVAQPGKLEAGHLEVSVPDCHLELVETRANLAFFKVTPLPGAHHLSAEVRERGASPVKARAEADVLSEPPASVIESPSPLSVAAAAGYFLAGGANHGLAAEARLAYALPVSRFKIHVEASVGVRSASLNQTVEGLGATTASVVGVPIDLGGRLELLQGEAWHLDVDLGLGPMPFFHHLTPTTSVGFSQSGLGFDAHLGAQAAYRLGRFELLAEVRGALSPAVTSFSDARLGGLVLLFGARFDP